MGASKPLRSFPLSFRSDFSQRLLNVCFVHESGREKNIKFSSFGEFALKESVHQQINLVVDIFLNRQILYVKEKYETELSALRRVDCR